MLLAALVGPFFVDWTAYRTTFERYGERLLGHRVAVMGDAEMRLLPTPMLTFTDVRVGEPEDPLLAVSRFAVRIELPPLMKGEVRIIDMTLERPALNLSLDERGRLDWFTALGRNGLLDTIDPDLVMLEQASVRDGRIAIVDARNGARHTLEDVDLTVSARSLLGPYKIDGMASHAGQRATLMLATGRRDAEGGIRLRAGITPVSVPVDLVADGRVTLDGGRLGYEGRFDLASVTPEDTPERAWTSEGAFALDIDTLRLRETTLRYGAEDRPVTLTGDMDLALAAPVRFDVTASANQIDLDRIAGRGPQDPLAAEEVGRVLLTALQGLPHPPVEGTVTLDVPALVSGGGLMQELRIEASRLASGWRIAELSGQAPGRSPFLLRGDLELKPRPAFRGSFAVSVAQPNAFADWWRQGVVLDAAVDPFAVESRLDVSPEGFALTDLAFEIAGETGRGAISYRVPRNGPPVFEVDLDADRLNADQAVQLTRLLLGGKEGATMTGALGDTQVALRLFAEELEVGGLEASALAVRAAYQDDVLTVDEANLADLAGARLSASGRIERLSTSPSGRLTVSVDAERLEGVAALIRRLAPEREGLAPFTSRPEAFAPARLDIVFDGEALAGGEGAGTQARIAANGTAGGTEIDADFGLTGRFDAWRAAAVDFELGISAEEGTTLLAQLGLPVLPVADLGAARIELGAAGIPEEGLDGHARFYLDDASLVGVGTLSMPGNEEVAYTADVVAKADNLLPFSLLTGRLPSLSSSVEAVDLVATVEGEGDAFTLAGLSGTVAGTRVDGTVEVDLRQAMADLDPRVRGRLALSDMDPAALSDLMLGADQLSAARSGGSWSTLAFGPPVLSGLDLALDLAVERMRLAPAPDATGVAATLGLKSDRLTLDVSQADFAGGRLTGTYAVSRAGGQAGLNASLRLENADLDDLVWQRAARPVATGRADLSLDLEGAGRSLSGIVSSLSGGGTLGVRDGELRGLNPRAFDLVIRAADAGLELDDDTIRTAFASHLDAGRLPFATLEASATISGGVVRVSNLSLDTEAATVFGNAQVDMDTLRLDSDFSLEVDPGAEAVTGAEPEVGLVFSGDLAAPERSIDIAPFTAFLTLRAFEQEVRRIEELQAEIDAQEREMDNRLRLIEREQRREEARQRAPGDPPREERSLRSADEPPQAPPEPQAPQEEAETPAGDTSATDASSTPDAPARDGETAVRRDSAPAAQPRPRQPAPQPSPAEGFQDRIRAALEELDARGRANPAETSDGAPMQLLPPLDPPVFIERAPDQ